MNRILSIFLVVFSTIAWAQQSSGVTGIVTDKDMNDDPLSFVNVVVKGTNVGVTSDIEGKFSLNLEAGNHTLVFSLLGYKDKETTIHVEAGKKTNLHISLGAGSLELEEVVVQTSINRSSESALLVAQKNAVISKQSIGSQEISRKGVGDVAAAVAKVSGVAKQEGSSNIFVRGLGDRYNSTSMNGLPIASNDPEKKNIALDLFSSDIVEVISIDKTYTTTIFGDFGGANVDISSKNYNGNGMFELSLGSKMNVNSLKNNDFKLQQGYNTFGYSSYEIPTETFNKFAFQRKLNPVSKFPLGGGVGLKAGKTFDVGSQKLSLFATANFDNGFNYREGINQTADAHSVTSKSYHHKKYAYQTNTTAMVNANYRFNSHHKIAYNSLFINSSEQVKDEYFGENRDYNVSQLLTQRNTYLQNTIYINQMIGNHDISQKIKFDWGVSFNKVKGQMPERTQNMLYIPEGEKSYKLFQLSGSDNNRYFQELVENEWATNVNILYNASDKSKIKLGYQGRFKNRDFHAVQFNFDVANATHLNVNPQRLDDFFNAQNFEANMFSIKTFRGKILIPEQYFGNQYIHGGFSNFEYQFSDKLGGVLGLRFEDITQIVAWDTQFGEGKNTFNKYAFLPSLALKYALTEHQNLRLGASKTYTLPQFKEKGRFAYEDVMDRKIGNPDLYASDNYNVDVKWEFFPKNDELYSVTFFGKYIQNPINEVMIASSSNDISWVNISDLGSVLGVELELRKNVFSVEGQFPNKLQAGFNLAYMKTHQDLDAEKVRRENRTMNFNINLTDKTSSFTGASDLLANADLTYIRFWKENVGITATLTYAYHSDKLYALSGEMVGNYIDKGFSSTDFILKTSLNKHIGIDFSAKNLTNPEFKRIQANKGGDVTAVSYKRGAFLSLGFSYKF